MWRFCRVDLRKKKKERKKTLALLPVLHCWFEWGFGPFYAPLYQRRIIVAKKKKKEFYHRANMSLILNADLTADNLNRDYRTLLTFTLSVANPILRTVYISKQFSYLHNMTFLPQAAKKSSRSVTLWRGREKKTKKKNTYGFDEFSTSLWCINFTFISQNRNNLLSPFFSPESL